MNKEKNKNKLPQKLMIMKKLLKKQVINKKMMKMKQKMRLTLMEKQKRKKRKIVSKILAFVKNNICILKYINFELLIYRKEKNWCSIRNARIRQLNNQKFR